MQSKAKDIRAIKGFINSLRTNQTENHYEHKILRQE
jgi:hypothetical protein